MKRWVCLAAVLCAAVGYAQGKAQGSTRADYIRYLADKPADESSRQVLLDALLSQDGNVRIEALKTWRKVSGAYDSLSFEVLTFDDSQRDAGLARRQAFHKDLIARIRPTDRDSEVAKVEALKTLCKIGYSAIQICPPMLGCGTGIQENLFWKAQLQLDDLADPYRKQLIGLQKEADPDLVYAALCVLGDDYQKTQKEFALQCLTKKNKYFMAIGAHLIGKFWPEISSDTLGFMLKDRDEDVRETGRWNIHFVGSNMYRAAVADHLPTDLRVLAIEQMSRTEDPDRMSIARSLILNHDPDIQAAAIGVYFGPNPKIDIPLLTKLLDNNAPQVHAVVLCLATKAEIKGVKSYIRAGLLSPDKTVRERALWCCMQAECSEFTPEQIKCVDLGVEEVWMASPAFDDPKYTYLIEECMKSSNPKVRQLVAFHYFLQEAEPFPTDLIIRLAKDSSYDVSKLVMSRLLLMKDPKAFATLIELAESKNEEIQIHAIRTLGESTRREGLPVLEKLTSDPRPDVAKVAKSSLTHLKNSLG